MRVREGREGYIFISKCVLYDIVYTTSNDGPVVIINIVKKIVIFERRHCFFFGFG